MTSAPRLPSGGRGAVRSAPWLRPLDAPAQPSAAAPVARTGAVDAPAEVIMVSLHDDRRMVEAAFQAGASGYLLKDQLDPDPADALAAVGRGETFRSASPGP